MATNGTSPQLLLFFWFLLLLTERGIGAPHHVANTSKLKTTKFPFWFFGFFSAALRGNRAMGVISLGVTDPVYKGHFAPKVNKEKRLKDEEPK